MKFYLVSCLRKKQASQLINIHPDLSQDAHSVTKFGDEIRSWKFSDEIPWQTFGEIFDCWACMMLFSLRWSLGKDALPIDRICDNKVLVLSVVVVIFFHCVLTSQKHPWRIVVARKFEVSQVFDVLFVVCRNCIQTALVATDRLGLFSKCGQTVSTYALTMYWRRVQLQSQNCFESFKDFLIRVWTVNECGWNLENS